MDIAWHDEIGAKSSALYSVIETAGQVYDKGMKSYLIMMAIRLIEMSRILKPTGSIYLHCDPTAHYLKLLMDTVFNKENFRNEVVWCYKGPSNSKKNFPRKHDYILFYAVSDQTKFNSNAVRVGYSESFLQRRKHNEGSAGITKGYAESRTINQFGKGKVVEDFWTDIPSGGQISKKERTGYPTQKPLALLERIISASSNPGDLVLDPFCGCASALVAAQKLERKWVGIDLSEIAVQLVKKRMVEETNV